MLTNIPTDPSRRIVGGAMYLPRAFGGLAGLDLSAAIRASGISAAELNKASRDQQAREQADFDQRLAFATARPSMRKRAKRLAAGNLSALHDAQVKLSCDAAVKF